ncbi:uncharacterized protein LOC128216932 [Mya arenaria]|uniref:uncharacterized protein LOC128216932 n=1 Tax=Mya arenaria TaxID=6604 RepID=UPI0022E3B409|nr:uncharacterized protein LOC128216932 [Mya arenaria]
MQFPDERHKLHLDRLLTSPTASHARRTARKSSLRPSVPSVRSSCVRVHRNQKITKSHALQDKDSMPSSFNEESEDEKFTETCQLHAKEFIKYYCSRHDALLCGDCLVENEEHRSCKVEKIIQVAKQYKQCAEYNNLKTGLVQLDSHIDKLSHDIQEIMKSVDEERLTNINELRKFRTEINQFLDKREHELLAEIDQKKQTSKTLLDELKSKCTNMKSSIEKINSELQAQDDNSNQLLIVGKRAIKELGSLRAALEEVSRRSEVPRYKFNMDPATEKLIASEKPIRRLEEDESTSALGQQHRQQQTKQEQRLQETMQQHQKQMEAVSKKAHFKDSADLSRAKFISQPDISVKTLDNTIDCRLTCVTLLAGERLLLSDCHNRSLKLVDTKNNKVVSQVKLPGQPWDLCLLPGDKAAATLPSKKKIQVVFTQGNVTLQNVVKVDGECRGIDFCGDNLIVSFILPGKVVMMDMKGKVKKSVYKDSSGKPLFQDPEYLTVTRENQTPPVIYVSDRDTHTITKLSISLEVLQSYQDPILKSPRGLAPVGDNQLLVCGWGSNSILLLDTLTGKITQLLGKEEGIEWPRSVAYCPLRKMVFVTNSQDDKPELQNFVKVFNLV